jgi:hypothetical protein
VSSWRRSAARWETSSSGVNICVSSPRLAVKSSATTTWSPRSTRRSSRCSREEGSIADYFVGLDLGQTQDFTAIAVVGLDQVYLEASRSEDAAYDRLIRAGEDPHLDEVDLRLIKREIEDLPYLPKPIFEVRHLERLALGTAYTEVALRVSHLMRTPPLRGNAELAADGTGVGAAVTDQLRMEGLRFNSVIITGGQKETREGTTHKVPKRDLIAAAQVLLQQRRLKIAPALPEAKTLVDELLNYRYRLSEAGNDVYGAWREGQHDDLVLALCLAVWAAERKSPPVDETLVDVSGRIFEVPTEPLFTLREPDNPW